MLPVGLRRVSFVEVGSRVRREFTQRLNAHIAKVISDGFFGSNIEGWPCAWENYKGSVIKASGVARQENQNALQKGSVNAGQCCLAY